MHILFIWTKNKYSMDFSLLVLWHSTEKMCCSQITKNKDKSLFFIFTAALIDTFKHSVVSFSAFLTNKYWMLRTNILCVLIFIKEIKRSCYIRLSKLFVCICNTHKVSSKILPQQCKEKSNVSKIFYSIRKI